MPISSKDFFLKSISSALHGLLHGSCDRIFLPLSNFILPPRCCGCGHMANEHHKLCSACWSRLTFISSPQCYRCGWPIPFDHGESQCGKCLAEPPPFEGGWSTFVYKDLVRSLIIRFKHGDATYLAPVFAKWLFAGNQRQRDQLLSCDYLIPVPMHRWRLLKRRYNQATLLARHLSPLCDVAVHPFALERIRNTDTQHKKSRQRRKENVRSAFRVMEKYREELAGKTVCLIDDVWTTGATLTACAKVLRRAGVAKVYVLSLARVVPDM